MTLQKRPAVTAHDRFLTYFWTFAARLAGLLGAFGTAVITARILGPEDRGRYYYLVTLAAVGAQLASCGIHASNNFLVARDANLLVRLAVNSVWIAGLGGILAAVAIVAVEGLIGGAGLLQAAIVVVLLCPATLLFLYLSNLAVGIGRPEIFNLLVIFNGAVSIACALLAATAPTLDRFLIAAVVAAAASGVLGWYLIAHHLPKSWRFDRELLKRSIAFALRAHVAALLGFLMNRTSVIVLRHVEAFSEVGYWSIAAQIADALLLLPSSIALLLFPALLRVDGPDRWREYVATATKIAVGMMVVCAIAWLLARPIIHLAFGTAYDPSADIVAALLPGVLFLSVTTIASQFLSAYGIPWTQLAAWATAWVLQVALSLAIAPSYGGVGLAVVQSACAGFVCLCLLVNAFFYSPRRATVPTSSSRLGH